MNKICHCGRPLHYTNKDIEAFVDRMVTQLGEFIEIVCENKTYKISRHYIALHGINGSDLDSLGFIGQEYKNEI